MQELPLDLKRSRVSLPPLVNPGTTNSRRSIDQMPANMLLIHNDIQQLKQNLIVPARQSIFGSPMHRANLGRQS